MNTLAALARLMGTAFWLSAAAIGSARAAPVLQVNAGILMGAHSVLVSGTSYDVSFVEGTCASVFGGCDAVTDFPFQSSALASTAAQALLDQVFIDGVEGNFDSDPSKTFGCGGGSINRCFVMTPGAFGSGTNINAPTATNTVAESGDGPSGSVVQASFDSSTSGQHVWAVWTRSTTRPLPAPGTPALLVAAALAAACTRHRGGAGAHGTS